MTTLPVHPVDLPRLEAAASRESAAPPQRLAALASVKAELTVVAGRATSSVGAILGLAEGALLTLDTPLDAPFDVVLNGTVVARGELVAVGDRFGIRVTDVQPAAR